MYVEISSETRYDSFLRLCPYKPINDRLYMEALVLPVGEEH